MPRAAPPPAAAKIGVCCYCGARTALVLGGARREELACGQCGAPLRTLKAIPVAAPAPPRTPPARANNQEKRSKPAQTPKPKPKRRERRRPRRRPDVWARFARSAQDWLEDALDEIEDIFD